MFPDLICGSRGISLSCEFGKNQIAIFRHPILFLSVHCGQFDQNSDQIIKTCTNKRKEKVCSK